MKPRLCPHVFERFTFRGYCEECAPELHRLYNEAKAHWVAKFELFKKETGIDALQDWYRFEKWNVSH